MKIERNALARLLAATTKVVPARNTLPILACVKLVAEGGKLTITATDLDIEVSSSAPVEGEASFCVDAKMLAGIVGKAGGSEITIEADDKTAVIKSGRSKYTLQTFPVGDFPTIQYGTFDAEFEADLATLFAPVQFAMSQETNRHYLCGVHLQPGIATATDGSRLSTNSGEAWAAHEPIIVPAKTVGVLPKGVARVSISPTKIRLETEDTVILSRLIEGTYPDFERVIPKNNDKTVTVDSAALKAAADRVAIVSSERGRGVKLSIGSGEIVLSVRGDGEASDVVPTTYDGDPVEIGFNAQYLADVLGAMPSGEVDLRLDDSMSPALLTTKSAEGLRLVIMPMRI